MPPTKSERRLHDTIRRLRSELATANATVAHLRKRLRDAVIVVDPVETLPPSSVATMADAIFQLECVDRSGSEVIVSHLKRRISDCDDDPHPKHFSYLPSGVDPLAQGFKCDDPADCDDDPGVHESDCGRCALCDAVEECDATATDATDDPRCGVCLARETCDRVNVTELACDMYTRDQKLEKQTHISMAVARERALSAMPDDGTPVTPLVIAKAIWPDRVFTGSGAGIATAKILSTFKCDGLARWVLVSNRSHWQKIVADNMAEMERNPPVRQEDVR